eukprot:5366824-Prymnesium_polylepis.1
MLLTDEEYPREQVRQGSRKHPIPIPLIIHPCMPLCASLRPLLSRIGTRCLHFPQPRSSRRARARTLCLLPMFGGSLSISCSRCAQKAAA